MLSSAEPLVTRLWFNIVWFQLCWLSAVLLQQPLVVAALLLVHLILLPNKKQEMAFIFLCAIPGLLIDSALTWFGLFQFSVPTTFILPAWLILLWFCFSATLNISLKYFADKLWLSALAGAIGGCSSYLAGARLDAVELGFSFAASAVILAPIWAVLFPVLFYLRRTFRPLWEQQQA